MRYNFGMPRVFLGNFDFEHELARPQGQVASDFAWIWLAIADAADFVVVPEEIDPGEFSVLAALGLSIPQFLNRPRRIAAAQDVELVHRPPP